MRPVARAIRIAPLALAASLALAAAVAPAPAAALSCTPMQSWTCLSHGFFNTLSGQPGEVVCGVDYTGWTLSVVNVTVTQGGWVRFVATAGQGISTHYTTKVILMDDCGAGTCVDSAQSNGLTELDSCLEAGTYTYIVATNSTAPAAVLQMDIICLTCAQGELLGLTGCAACNPVSDESSSWGSFKVRFK